MTVPPGSSAGAEGEAAQLPGCVRHPDRPTGLRCTRCDRPACPDCLREAAVGYQCVDCVSLGQRGRRQPVTIAGARLGTKPIVVPALILANVVVYVITAVQAGNPMQNITAGLFSDFALWPILAAAGEWWRLITSGFLHIGITHLIMNMIALWVIGRDLELVLGRVRFVAVYLLSLLGGSAAVFLFGNPEQPVAGASGAVYGLMGGIAIAAFRLKVSLRPVLIVIALNIVITFTIPGISILGHLGGIVLGTVATAALIYAPRQFRNYWQGGALAVLLLVLLAVVITKDMMFGDLICVETSGGTHCGIRS